MQVTTESGIKWINLYQKGFKILGKNILYNDTVITSKTWIAYLKALKLFLNNLENAMFVPRFMFPITLGLKLRV